MVFYLNNAGEMRWNSGHVYCGTWQKGKFDGQGTMFYSDKRKHMGGYV